MKYTNIISNISVMPRTVHKKTPINSGDKNGIVYFFVSMITNFVHFLVSIIDNIIMLLETADGTKIDNNIKEEDTKNINDTCDRCNKCRHKYRNKNHHSKLTIDEKIQALSKCIPILQKNGKLDDKYFNFIEGSQIKEDYLIKVFQQIKQQQQALKNQAALLASQTTILTNQGNTIIEQGTEITEQKRIVIGHTAKLSELDNKITNLETLYTDLMKKPIYDVIIYDGENSGDLSLVTSLEDKGADYDEETNAYFMPLIDDPRFVFDLSDYVGRDIEILFEAFTEFNPNDQPDGPIYRIGIQYSVTYDPTDPTIANWIVHHGPDTYAALNQGSNSVKLYLTIPTFITRDVTQNQKFFIRLVHTISRGELSENITVCGKTLWNHPIHVLVRDIKTGASVVTPNPLI